MLTNHNDAVAAVLATAAGSYGTCTLQVSQHHPKSHAAGLAIVWRAQPRKLD